MERIRGEYRELTVNADKILEDLQDVIGNSRELGEWLRNAEIAIATKNGRFLSESPIIKILHEELNVKHSIFFDEAKLAIIAGEISSLLSGVNG